MFNSKLIPPKRKQTGFILSLEAVLLFTVLGIGLLLGLSALRNALFKYYVSQQDERFIAADSSVPAILIGKVIGFDKYNAPQVVFVDYHNSSTNPLPGGFNYRTIIGVRDDRFTSGQVLFYSANSCQAGPVCIASPGSEIANTLVGNRTTLTGTISYLNAMQGSDSPSYAVGRNLSASSTQDLLYRSTTAACTVTIQSMWVSETVLDSGSCIAVSPNFVNSDLSSFKEAVEVLMPTGVGNVLSGLIAPYYINMIDTPTTDFTFTAPPGELP
tara:strand:- start:5357 stop:6169 length:813 start_codon:yes stop_codon:yes gene_type:complete